MRTSNPALRAEAFTSEITLSRSGAMTVSGSVQKTFILLALAIGSAAFSWNSGPLAGPLMIGGVLGGLVLCLIICFKKNWAPMLAPAYAICEGLFLGALSHIYQRAYDGIVMQAVMLTFGTAFALLTAYQTGLVRATQSFKTGVIAATGGIALVYLVTMVLSFFGIQVPFIHQGGWMGIAFSAFVVVIAALNLVLDFDLIEQGAAVAAPKYLEWYAAFGLLVTLVWLYIEILRLLMKLRSR
jgi:uncharacterized YccA/Bax inhibitor family protein